MSRKLNDDISIPPGSYTRETLPPLSPGALAILEEVKRSAAARKESQEETRIREASEAAYRESGDLGCFIATMLGAEPVSQRGRMRIKP